jgi:hypothetical protein
MFKESYGLKTQCTCAVLITRERCIRDARQIQIQIQISLLFLKNITFLSEEITINCSAVHKDWRKEGEDTQDLS